MSDETRYYEGNLPDGRHVRVAYTAPKSTEGMHNERQKVQSFSARPGTIRPILRVDAIRAMGGDHEGTFRSKVLRYAPNEATILQNLLAKSKRRQLETLLSEGEANRVLPDRGSFSSDPSSKRKRDMKASYKRGDVVVHSAAHTRLTIMGPSRSKPGFLKAVDRDGRVFRVSPRNINPL